MQGDRKVKSRFVGRRAAKSCQSIAFEVQPVRQVAANHRPRPGGDTTGGLHPEAIRNMIIGVREDRIRMNMYFAVAPVTDSIGVGIPLIIITDQRAVVAGIAKTISIAVGLRRILNILAVVGGVHNAVIVDVGIASVSETITIGVVLVEIGDSRTIVAGIADAVVVGIELIRVGDSRAIVKRVNHRSLSESPTLPIFRSAFIV